MIYNILYIFFTVLGAILLLIYSDKYFEKYKKILMVAGIVAILFSYIFNTCKENESDRHFNNVIDTLRQDNKKLFMALSYNENDRQINYDTIVQLYKKYNYSSLKIIPEIQYIKPVVYIDENYLPATNDFPAFPKLGIYFIISFKNGSEPITVNGLKIKCKLFLDYSQYLMFDEVTGGKQIQDIKRDCANKKPYIVIDWDAYPSKKTILTHFYPYQQGYIGFVLLEPTLSGQSEGGWNLPKTQYLGYEDNSLVPTKIRKYPDFTLFFSDFNINRLPPRKIRDDFKFYIILDSQEYLIDREKILPVDRVSKYEWENDSFEKMFLRYYAE